MLPSNYSTFFSPADLVQLVQYQAALQPDEPAFIYLANGADEEVILTNAELDRSARRLAAYLQSKNMFGQRALLLYPPGLDFIKAYFGCIYAGTIAVPVYPPRKNRSMIRIQAVAESAGAAVALTVDDVLKRTNELLDETPNLKNIPWISTASVEEGLENNWTEPDVDADTIAFLQYTSGSTGSPKGVILTHGNLLHNSRMIRTGFEHTRSGVGVFWLPSYHDMGLIGGIIQPLYCGRSNMIMSPLSFLQKPYRWLAAITKYKATTSGGPNFAYDLCVRQITEEQVDTLDLSSWTVAFNGAEPVLAETMEAFAAKFERCGFRYESFYPCFGLAEGTLIVTGGYVKEPPIVRAFDAEALSIGKAVDASEETAKTVRHVSSGRNILPDEHFAVVDPETNIECPDRVVGEIWASGPSMARGYWNNPEATEITFHAHIAGDSQNRNYMRTGDLGFAVDGELFVTGRIKDLIIIRGVNLYPQDIELTVQKSNLYCRPLGGAAVMVKDNTPKQAEHLVIVQELERRFKGDAEVLFNDIRRAVAVEHEIPVDAIVLVKSGSIPKTSSGKIQHHACRSGFLDGSLSEIARWVSPDVSFTFIQGEGAGNDLLEATGLTIDADDHKRLVRGKIDMPDTRPLKPVSVPPVNVPAAIKMAVQQTGSALPMQVSSREDIAAVVLEEVRRVAKERAAGLTLDSDITELGLDSLERMEILASIEDRFGGQFPESILPDLLTANQVLDAVLLYLGTGLRKRYSPPVKQEETPPETVGTMRKINEFAVPCGYSVNSPSPTQSSSQSDDTVHRPLSFNSAASQAVDWDETCVFAKFPEYQKLAEGLNLIQQTGLNRFFDVHEGITNDRAQIGGKEYINFSNYNYVNTSGAPEVTQAAIEACQKYGTSVSASRLVSGNKPLHRELENEISRFLGTEDTIVMVGGHSTNEGTIGHLLNDQDMILFDALAHNSIVEGALLSGARRRPFPHNDWQAAEWILSKHRSQYRRVLIAVEGVYSMDGDYPDLPKLIEVKKKHKALLMVDEAHSLGVLGKTGRGIGEHFGVNRSDVDIWMCTLSKTFASCGGYISGCKELVEYLKYTAPNFVFSVGLPPSNTAAALAALRLLEREPQRVEQLRRNCSLFLELAKKRKLDTGTSKDSAVVPVILGNSMLALQISKALFDKGINVQPILHPAVEEKAARLRFFITSAHTEEQIRYTVDCTAKALTKLNGSRRQSK